MVSLPEVQGALLGPASGRVVDAGGAEVATFGFESGWVIPPSWDFQGTTPPRSGASTTLTVELPAPGPYTFELDDFSVSGPPCGTCAARFEGGRVTVEVMDGTVVELPAGEQLAVS